MGAPVFSLTFSPRRTPSDGTQRNSAHNAIAQLLLDLEGQPIIACDRFQGVIDLAER